MSPEPTPIQLTIPPPLLPHAVPLATYQSTYPPSTTLVVCTYLFDPAPKSAPTLLLLRRARTERTFAHKYEPPGGSSESTDPTILHSAAREMFEETGLKVRRFVRQVGEGLEFWIAGRRWVKVGFEVEVVTGEGRELEITLDPEEHDAWVWATEEGVRDGEWEITTSEQRELVLRAFELRRGEGAGHALGGEGEAER